MKEKYLTLVIGILIGAILASGGFLIYNKAHSSKASSDIPQKGQMRQMDGNGEKPDFTNGEKSFDKKNKNFSNDQMPNNGEMPDGEAPAKPEDNNTDTTSQS